VLITAKRMFTWGKPGKPGTDGMFPNSFYSPRNHSPALIAVRPPISTILCKALNIFIKMCYSLPCTPHPILARSSLRNLRVLGASALDHR